jgi:succinoglycan biosynthesis protein ExoW
LTAPQFTVLLPVHRGPDMLPFAIESVLRQSRPDFELVVICDGAPASTLVCALGYAEEDPRIRVSAHEKGKRHGELYRDQALQEASGDFVCQIADDDLWFPDHLAEMAVLLGAVDFGNLTHTGVTPAGRFEPSMLDLGVPEVRRRMLQTPFNFLGPTATGYRMEAYRNLPDRWAPGPSDVWSDLNMWRKFLRQPDLKFGTRHSVTSLAFATPQRRSFSAEQRREENRSYAERIRDPLECAEIRAAVLRDGFGWAGHDLVELMELKENSRALARLLAGRMKLMAGRPAGRLRRLLTG